VGTVDAFQGHLRNLRRKLFDLDAKELVHVHADQAVHVHRQLPFVGAQFVSGPQHFALQLAQFAVADDQEVATAAGRVKKLQLPQLFVSAVTLGEIQAGIELTREQDPEKAQQIEDWLALVASAYNVLPMDAAAFKAWAKLMHRKSDTLYEDAMMAATAKVHGLTVATRNVADFQALGFEVFNPFAPV